MTRRRRAASRARVRAFLHDLERLGAGDLGQIALDHAGSARRGADRAEAIRASEMGGLGPVLEDARAAARDEVLHAYAISMYQPTLVGLNWGLSLGTTDDRVAVATAAEDAAIAVVAKDVVDADVYDRLRESFDLVGSMRLRATTGRSSAWAQTSRRFPIAFFVVVVVSIAIYASQFGYVAVAIPIVAAVIIIATARSASRRENDPSGDDEGPIDLPRPWLGAAGVAGIIVLTLPFLATGSVPVIVFAEATAILAIAGIIAWIRSPS